MRPASEVAEAVMGSFYGNRAAIIEADRKQVREAAFREVVQYLIEGAERCDCGAYIGEECSCGGRWGDKRKSLRDMADEIKRKYLGEKA